MWVKNSLTYRVVFYLAIHVACALKTPVIHSQTFRVFFCVSACVWTCTLMFFAERNHSGWMWNKNVFSKILESPSGTKKLKSVIWHEHKLTYFRCKHSKSNVISEELLTKFFLQSFLILYIFVSVRPHILWNMSVTFFEKWGFENFAEWVNANKFFWFCHCMHKLIRILVPHLVNEAW